jgi:hypothetical protein
MITPETVKHGGQVRALRSFADMDFPENYHWIKNHKYLVAISNLDIYVTFEGPITVKPNINAPMSTMRFLRSNLYVEFEPVNKSSREFLAKTQEEK